MALIPSEYTISEHDTYDIVSAYSLNYKLSVTKKGDTLQFLVPSVKPIPVSAGTVDLLAAPLPSKYRPVDNITVKMIEPNNNALISVTINTNGMLRITTYSGTTNYNFNLNVALVGVANN